MTYLAIFGRAVEPGKTKTRLIPMLGEVGAANLYACFLADVIETHSDQTDCTELWVAGDLSHESLALYESQVSLRPQPSGDLGQRMSAALAHGLADHDRAMVIGTDSPTLPRGLLKQALEQLNETDVVFGPSADGGYYLVGARRPLNFPPLNFDGVPWSSPNTLAASISCAEAQGLSTALLPPWYDIDDPEDLRLLRAHLSLNPLAAPNTAKHLGALGVGQGVEP